MSQSTSSFLLSSTREKAASLSNAQRQTLMDIVSSKEVIHEMYMSHEVVVQKRAAWREVAEEFNMCYPSDEPLTVRRLKRAWEYSKNRDKREWENYAKQLRENGVAPPPTVKKSQPKVRPMSSSMLAHYADNQYDSFLRDIPDPADRTSGLKVKEWLASPSSQHQKDLGDFTGQEEASRKGTVSNMEDDKASAAVEDGYSQEEDNVVPQKKQKCSNGKDPPSVSKNCAKQDNRRVAKKPSLEPTKPPQKAFYIVRKEPLESNKKEEKSPDPTDLFFQSIAATIKRFTPYHQSLCKSKVFAVVSEIEMKEILEQDPSAASVLATPDYTAGDSTLQNSQAMDSSPSLTADHSEEALEFKFQYEEL